MSGTLRNCLAGLLSGLTTAAATAQDLEPRSYTNVPVDLNFLLLGAVHSEGDLAPTPSTPLRDAELDIDSLVAAYARTFALAGSSAKFAVSATRLCWEGSALFDGEPVTGGRCEYGDPEARLTWNFYGAPALQLENFGQWDRGLVVGTSLQVSAPWGSYDSERLINGGTNRWMVRPGLGMTLRQRQWQFELMGSIKLFQDNDDYFGGVRLEQEPLYSLQGHVIYNFPRGRWLSLNANYYWGGETSRDGIEQEDQVKNSRWGMTLGQPLNLRHSLKLYASTGVWTRAGTDFDTLGIAWQYLY